jgi:hypothetical protein
MGRTIEPRKIATFGTPTPYPSAEGNIRSTAIVRCIIGARAVEDFWHVRTRNAREPGDPGFVRGAVARTASGSLRT